MIDVGLSPGVPEHGIVFLQGESGELKAVKVLILGLLKHDPVENRFRGRHVAGIHFRLRIEFRNGDPFSGLGKSSGELLKTLEPAILPFGDLRRLWFSDEELVQGRNLIEISPLREQGETLGVSDDDFGYGIHAMPILQIEAYIAPKSDHQGVVLLFGEPAVVEIELLFHGSSDFFFRVGLSGLDPSCEGVEEGLHQ